MEYAYGRASENLLSSLMMTKFGVTLCPDKYAHFDYESEDTLVELKTRRVMSNAYPDYMMNGCKLRAAAASGKKVYFVFRFLDGVFYWEYDPTIELRTDYNGRKDRGRDETQFMHYLPASLFKKLE
jgi:hypothetical protein